MKTSSFNRQKSQLFRERFFIYQTVPESKDQSGESGKDRREALADESRRNRSSLENPALELTFVIGTQKDFDQTMEDLDEDGLQNIVNQNPENIDRLIDFALNSARQKENMAKILEALDDKDLRIEKFSDEALSDLLGFYASDSDNLATVIDAIFDAVEEKNIGPEKLTFTVKFFQEDKEEQFATLLERVYEMIDDKDLKLSEIDKDLLGLLIAYFWEKSDKKKIGFILDEMSKTPENASKLLEISGGQEEFIKAVFDRIKDKNEIIHNVSHEATMILIHQMGLEKIQPLLTGHQKIRLISKAKFKEKEERKIIESIYVDRLPTALKMDFINNKTVNPSFKKYLYESLNEADRKTLTEEVRRTLEGEAKPAEGSEPKEGPEAAAEEPKADPQADTIADKTIDLNKITDLDAILQEAGLTNRGNWVVWDFTVEGGTTSERGFVKTAKFKTQFTKFINEQKALNKPLDAELVKSFCYDYLWREIYKNGDLKENRFGVTEFEKSQDVLQTERERIKAKSTPKTAPVEEPAATAQPEAAEQPAATAQPEAAEQPAAAPQPEAAAPEAAPEAAAPAVATAQPEAEAPDEATGTPAETTPAPVPKDNVQAAIAEAEAALADVARRREAREAAIAGNPTEAVALPAEAAPTAAPEPSPAPTPEVPTQPVQDAATRRDGETSDRRSTEKPADKIPLKDLGEAIAELRSSGLASRVTTEVGKELTVTQFETLKSSLNEILETINNGKNLFDILEKLRNIDKKSRAILADSGILKITFNATPHTPTIEWDLQSKTMQFGEEGQLRNSIFKMKEKQFGGKDNEEYQTFIATSISQESAEIEKFNSAERTAEYRSKYKELTEKVYELNIGNLSEEEIVSNWKGMSGRAGAEKIMKNPPFSFNEDGEIAKKAGEIISDCNNDRVYFADVFSSIRDVPSMDPKEMTDLISGGANRFMKKFDKLLKAREKGELTDKNSLEQLEIMFNEIIVPCLELLRAFKKLQAPKEKGRTAAEKTAELPQEQKEILETLVKLCNFNDQEAGGWEKFIGMLSGAEGQMTMSDMDGNAFTVSQGKFHDHYSPKAALAILTNINEDKNKDGAPDHYSFDGQGTKIFNKEAMLAEINERIQLGVANMIMAEVGAKGGNPSREEIHTMILNRAPYAIVSDLSKITPEQIKAFQLGFILKEARKFAEKVTEAKQALDESAEDPTIKNHPLFKQIASALLDQDIQPGKVRVIQEKVLFAAGASFKNGKFEGAGLGTRISIGDGMSVLIGIGANDQGNVNAGIGLEIKVYRGKRLVASFIAEIGLMGATLGASQTIKTDSVNIHLFEGLRWSWDSVIPTVGGAFGFSVNMDKRLEEKLKEAEGKTDYTAIWEEWKQMPQSDIEGKFAKLQQLPQLWNRLEAIIGPFGLTNTDIVNMVEGIREELTRDVLENLDSPIPIFSYVGFGMLGPIPIPHVGIKLGSAEVSVPNRRAISKILHELSDRKVTLALEKAVKEVDTGEKTPVFIEQTGKLVYGRDGKLMSLVKREEIDLKNFQTDLETYNTQLKRTEMALAKNENGTVALKVFGTDMKDVEIHIDPKLTELALVKDGGMIVLEGNIDDLIISRERFGLPFETTEGNASMRDVITIRQRVSLLGKRDATWIQQYESGFLQKLESDAEFSLQAGNSEHKQSNLLEIRSYGTGAIEELPEDQSEAVEKIKYFIDKRPSLSSQLGSEKLETMEAQTNRRFQALENTGRAMPQENYEKLAVRENLFSDLAKIFPAKNAFTKEFRSKINNDEALVKILVKHSGKTEGLKDLNEREINLAITHLINLHFTNLYAEATSHKSDGSETLKPAEIQKINQSVLANMERKIQFVKNRVLIPKFQATIAQMERKPTAEGKELTATNLVDKLIGDTYISLRAQLNDPSFDFRNINVEDIPAGAFLFSGSRLFNKNGTAGALSENISYETLAKEEQSLLGFGFLEGTIDNYNLNSADETEKALARVILEISSPIPKDDLEFLYSPLAMKFAGLNTGILLSFNEDNQFDDYQKITEIYENQTLLQNSPAHKQALGRFKILINELRLHQLDNSTFEKKIGKTGLTLRIKMDTTITHGAYSQCGNPSFYVQENAEISILKGRKILAEFNSTNEVIDTELTKIFVSIGIGIGLKSDRVSRPAPAPKPITIKVKPEGGVSTEAPAPLNPRDPMGTPAAPDAISGGSGGPGVE